MRTPATSFRLPSDGLDLGFRSAILASALAVVVLTGCGTSNHPRPAICTVKGQTAIAHDLHVGFGTISFAKSLGGNGMPQCTFKTRAGAGKAVVLVNVDSGPSAYFRLLRTVDEATQIFGPPPPGFHAPQGISGLGPFASWFPNNHQLMATNRVDLLTVTITWPGATRNSEVKLAKAVIVPYLAHPHGHGNANDYP